jgi:hypothetical protein
MAEMVDRPNGVIPPPIAWGLAIVAGLGQGWPPVALCPDINSAHLGGRRL